MSEETKVTGALSSLHLSSKKASYVFFGELAYRQKSPKLTVFSAPSSRIVNSLELNHSL